MNQALSSISVSVLSGLLVLFVGCAGLRAQSEPVIVKRAQMHMGTLVKITAVAQKAFKPENFIPNKPAIYGISA